MQKRTLGNSELHISEISLGCMSLPTTINDARPIIETALDAGINYFDTADLYDYGINEEIIGTIIKPHRQNIMLATKVGNRWHENQEGWHWDASPSYIMTAVKKSLRRLQTDYIDLYQLHGGTNNDTWDDIIFTFDTLKKQGYIREYGISSIRPNVIQRFFTNSNAISNMMQYNLLDRRAEEWFAFLEQQGASVVTRGTIAKGLLTKERYSRNTKGYGNYAKDELQKTLSKLEANYEDLHALALRFNLNHKTIASTVIGASTVTQLQENLAAYERSTKIDDLQRAFELTKEEVYTEHRE